MPRAVDPEARLHEIAAATLAVAKRDGVEGITFRSVAAELGASTTAVTHYVGSRAALIRLLFDHLFGGFRRYADAVLGSLRPELGLHALAEGALPLRDDTRLAARLFLGVLADDELRTELTEVLRDYDGWQRTWIRRFLEPLDVMLSTERAVDLIVATLDGVTLAAIDEPEAWPAERQRTVIADLFASLGIPSRDSSDG